MLFLYKRIPYVLLAGIGESESPFDQPKPNGRAQNDAVKTTRYG